MTAPSWKPIRCGETFCSPACGRGCTKAEHAAAKIAAAMLCKHLGRGWKPHVWENLGWHYSAISPCGRWKVSPCISRGTVEGYNAFLGETDFRLGGHWSEHGATPDEAIAKTRKAARRSVAYLSGLLDMAKSA